METTEQFGGEKRKYQLPDILRKTIERIDDDTFWTERNLEKMFREDPSFGVKMWTGLNTILEKRGLRGDTPKYIHFSDQTEILNLKATSPGTAAQTLIGLRNWLKDTYGIAFDEMSAKNILFGAYEEEAEVIRAMGGDPEVTLPFSIGVGLNPEHSEVKNTLQKEAVEEDLAGRKKLKDMMEINPELKAKMGDRDWGIIKGGHSVQE